MTKELPAAEDGIERRDVGGSARRDDDDTSPSSSTDAAAITDRASGLDHIDALKRLEREYRRLNYLEDNISKCLSMLRDEEISLRLGHEQSSRSLRQQREYKSKRMEDEAVARLEKALMMDEDSSDESDGSSGMLVSEAL
ncbi:hypothetical protein ACHAXA_003115 [Cyclostephanos tholiformis]|uniref:Uncharacterized protein n=2 Tax=Cyclostephanos tholiformis TaxID=382380 RepID=A0ABD3SSQ4_9STRA